MKLFSNRYEVERLLGEGGSGRVYLVRDRIVGDRRLALKELRSVRLAPAELEVLAREFRLLTRLRHPNLVEVYDFQLKPSCFFTMEYVEGRDLRAAHLEEEGLFDATIQVCRALEHIHRFGLVHLDVKPANILIRSEGRSSVVKLMDFGIASERRATRAHGYTWGFAAPEILEEQTFDGRADLFSLGMTLLLVGTGEGCGDSTTTLDSTRTGRFMPGPFVPHARELEQLPPRLASIVERLVRGDPAERFGSAAQVIEAIATVLGREIPVETAATRTGYIRSARLSGRRDELNQLLRAYSEAKDGLARQAVLVARAGVGKSRLVKELVVHAQLDGALVAAAAGSERGTAYGPFASLIGQLTGAVKETIAIEPRHLVELARLVPELRLAPAPATLRQAHDSAASEGDLDSEASRSRLTEAVLSVIDAATRARPVVLAIDDAHDLDEPSAQLLSALSARMQRGEITALLMVLAGRPQPDAPERLAGIADRIAESALLLALSPMSFTEVRELVEGVVGAGVVPEGFLVQLAELSGGNAFFLCELLKLLADLELLVPREGGWRCDAGRLAAFPIPHSALEIVAERLRRLPLSLRRILWLAAFLGTEIQGDEIEEVERTGTIRADLVDLVGRQLLVAEGRSFRFAHAEVDGGARADSLAAPERPLLHRRLAQAVAKHGGHPADVARLFAASDEPWLAIRPARAAGRRAVAVFDYAAAVRHYDQALALLETHPDRTPDPEQQEQEIHRLRLDAIRRGGLGGSEPRAERVLALARSLDPLAEAEAGLDLARISLQRGQFAEAHLRSKAALELAGEAPTRTRAEALRLHGLASYNLGDLEAALADLDLAVSDYRSLGDEVGEAGALNDRGFVHGYMGDFPRAFADHEGALQILERVAEQGGSLDALASTRNNLGFVCWYLGRYDAALAHLTAALQLRRRLRDLYGEGVTHNNLGNVLRHRGNLAGAIAEYELAIVLCRRSSNVLYEAVALNNLGQICEERDEFERAIALYEKALTLARWTGDRIREGDNLGNLGICLLRRGEVHQAHELLAESVALRREIGDRTYLVLDLSFHALASQRLGLSEEARTSIGAALGMLDAGQQGIEQEQAVYLNAYSVYAGLELPERALSALEKAAALVRQRLGEIPDPKAREAFLSQVRVNREIAEACRSSGLGDLRAG